MTPFFRLTHGQAGEEYRGKLTPINDVSASFRLLDIKLPDGIALSVNLTDATLSGIVSTPGEYDIIVDFYRPGIKPLQEQRERLTLLIVPNPKLMWKNLPSPRTGPYWVAEEKHSLTAAAGFAITAASKRGRSHAHLGGFRDDNYAIRSDGPWLLAVAADGAGSAKYSRKGAEIVCELASTCILDLLIRDRGGEIDAALQQCQTRGDTEPLQGIFTAILHTGVSTALNEIKRECQTSGGDGAELRDYSTTALITISRQLDTAIIIASYSVGDGAIAVYGKDAGLALLSSGDAGEYAGQTRFLDEYSVTEAEVKRRTKVLMVQDMAALMIMTDGVSDPFFETDNQLMDASRWNALWQQLSAADTVKGEGSDMKLLSWLDFWSKGNHDDRTLIIITQDKHG